jgi:hypothetical protein
LVNAGHLNCSSNELRSSWSCQQCNAGRLEAAVTSNERVAVSNVHTAWLHEREPAGNLHIVTLNHRVWLWVRCALTSDSVVCVCGLQSFELCLAKPNQSGGRPCTYSWTPGHLKTHTGQSMPASRPPTGPGPGAACGRLAPWTVTWATTAAARSPGHLDPRLAAGAQGQAAAGSPHPSHRTTR